MGNMKIGALLLAALALGASLPAAQQSFQGRAFEAHVSRSGGGPYREFGGAQPTLKVRAGEEYTITVRNPLPVRVGVAVSIDGLNSIDGKRSSPRNARKWMIEPHGTLQLKGWQTSGDKARAFVFTDEGGSYAKWKEQRDKKEYSRNLGVIGVAWFWNAAELERVLHPPAPFDEDQNYSKAEGARSKRADSAPAPAAAAGGRAGTGMGQEQYNPVTEVEFNATAGMFRVKDVLKIFYEFAEEPRVPQPFESDEGDGRFAPAMD